ncbi:MAG TPA: Mpo1-like protein [Gemmataceae bacterium]|nr:Mpo1-like protein [Gemmataceae bacterium]
MSQTPSPAEPSAPRRPLLAFLRRRLQGWRLRHQLPFNFWIHVIGIPMAVCGLILLLGLWPASALGLPWPAWYWGVGAFVLGYLLQWIGHLAEGNDLGEWAAIKRLLGLPYVGVAPRWNPEDPDRL